MDKYGCELNENEIRWKSKLLLEKKKITCDNIKRLCCKVFMVIYFDDLALSFLLKLSHGPLYSDFYVNDVRLLEVFLAHLHTIKK